MHKKLMMACMAIAAFAAFVIAPVASASPVLSESGTALAVGSSITAKNNGITKFTGGFGVECKEAHLKGTVTENSGTSIKGEIPVGSATFTNEGGAACSSSLGATTVNVTSKICLATVKGTDNLTVTGCTGSKGEALPVTFDLTTGGVTCKYSQASLTGTYTTSSTPGKAGLSEAAASEEEPRSFFCPDTGSLDMTFEMFTTGGTAISIS